MSKRMDGRRVLITGGGTGIGRGIAELFVAQGARVVVCGRRHGPLAETVGALRAVSPHAHFVECDVSDASDVDELVKQTDKLLGGLDTLVNNAGIYEEGNVETTEIALWDRILGVNLRGPFLVTRACVPLLRENQRGCVLNISSTLGRMAERDVLAYSVSKAGLDMFTRCTALDLAPHGIRVNAISPAVIDTPMQDRGKNELGVMEWIAQMAHLHPLGSVGKAADVARAALYLCSAEAEWITGVNLPVDGGLSAQ